MRHEVRVRAEEVFVHHSCEDPLQFGSPFSSYTCQQAITSKVNITLPDRVRKINDKLNVSKDGVDAKGMEHSVRTLAKR